MTGLPAGADQGFSSSVWNTKSGSFSHNWVKASYAILHGQFGKLYLFYHFYHCSRAPSPTINVSVTPWNIYMSLWLQAYTPNWCSPHDIILRFLIWENLHKRIVIWEEAFGLLCRWYITTTDPPIPNAPSLSVQFERTVMGYRRRISLKPLVIPNITAGS